MAVYLAEAGVNLVLVARRRAILENLAADLTKQHRIETRVIDADLAQPAGVQAVIDAGRDLDVGLLVASAGYGTSGRFIDSAIDDELNMLDVNNRAVLAMTHAFGKRFAARGRGGLVLISSLVAFQGVPFAAHYAATKAYVQTLAEGLHVELAPLGVDVIASAPGPIATGFAARANMQMNRALTPQVVARETLHALGRRQTVRPGRLSKLLEGALTLLPRSRRVRVMGRIMGGMTAHQAATVRKGVA
jgi:short-subunit dehydrogenase